MNGQSVRGACQCGAVQYEISGPIHDVTHCHCSMCRKLHGALFVSFGMTESAGVAIRGEDNLGDYESSPGVHRRFCRICGGRIMAFADETPDVTYMCLGTLDAGQTPNHDKAKEQHIFWESRAPWYDPADGVTAVTRFGEEE